MPVRRIFTCVLVVGIACLGGMGVMRGIAQTETPVLTPDQFKPANYAYPKAPGTPAPDAGPLPDVKPPEIIDPLKPASPEAMPLLAPPMPMMLPPAGDKTAVAPEVPMPPAVPPTPPKTPLVVVTPEQPTPAEVPFSGPRTSALERVKPDMPSLADGNRTGPMISIETIAPNQVQFGLPVSYEIVVKNGPVALTQVRVDEELSAGAKFVGSEPAAEVTGDRASWAIGTMNPGEEKHIKVTVKPGEGDLITKPRVSCAIATTNSVHITRPALVMNITAPDMVQVGDEVPVKIQVSNTGNGEASKILLKAILTDGLKHSEGNDIQALLSKLCAGRKSIGDLAISGGSAGPSNVCLDNDHRRSAEGIRRHQVRCVATEVKLGCKRSGQVHGESRADLQH